MFGDAAAYLCYACGGCRVVLWTQSQLNSTHLNQLCPTFFWYFITREKRCCNEKF